MYSAGWHDPPLSRRFGCGVPQALRFIMADAPEEKRITSRTVKDVPADAFIAAFAAHLKKSGKVRRCGGLRGWNVM